MKLLYIIALLTFICGISLGIYNTNEDGSLSWTLGETVIETVSNESGVLTQGFQQSWFFITPVEEIDTPGIDISIYPNPVNDIVTLEFLSDEELPEFHLELFDLLGTKVMEKTIKQTYYKEQLHLARFATDMFSLRVTNMKTKEVRTFKILKVRF